MQAKQLDSSIPCSLAIGKFLMDLASSQASESERQTKRQGFNLNTERMRDNFTGWLFVAPAMLLTTLFGLFPIVFAFYMSIHRWQLTPDRLLCMEGDTFSLAACFSQYTKIVGDWYGAFVFVLGFFLFVAAYWLWAGEKAPFTKSLTQLSLSQGLVRILVPLMLLVSAFLFVENGFRTFEIINTKLVEPRLSSRLSENAVEAWNQSSQTQVAYDVLRGCDGDDLSVEAILACLNGAVNQVQIEGYLQFVTALLATLLSAWLLFFAHRSGISRTGRYQETRDWLIRFAAAFLTMGMAAHLIGVGFSRMSLNGHEDYLHGLTITLYYALGSVPLQLGLGLLLAYVLYQNIHGKEFFRMMFFLPYVTPAVASAVIFRIVFNPRAGLANNFLGLFGIDQLPWINGANPFLNDFFGLDLSGFWAGPSSAMVSVIVLGIWMYTGYNAVIFLSGLGQIPGDLYEAAEVDGASTFDLFRYITLPLLSPITFYLSILAFIGTFKAFNTIFVMRTDFAQNTVDTAALVIFDTFRVQHDYGLAAAQAILLFLIILALTQVQRTFFEKQVFYA
jgi:ABC-type sugar transport system permease subunit